MGSKKLCANETDGITEIVMMQCSDVVIKVVGGEITECRIKRKYGKFTRPIYRVDKTEREKENMDIVSTKFPIKPTPPPHRIEKYNY